MLSAIINILAMIFLYTNVQILIQLGLILVGFTMFVTVISLMFTDAYDQQKYKMIDVFRKYKGNRRMSDSSSDNYKKHFVQDLDNATINKIRDTDLELKDLFKIFKCVIFVFVIVELLVIYQLYSILGSEYAILYSIYVFYISYMNDKLYKDVKLGVGDEKRLR